MKRKTKVTPTIIGERDIDLHLSNFEHHQKIASICHALSSTTRLKILNLLKNSTLSIQEIASILNIPISSTASHIKILEDAKLVVTESQPGLHGLMRVCTCSMQSFHLQTFDSHTDSANNVTTIDMPVGNYFQCDVIPTCGLADENGIIDSYDNARVFYLPSRTKAQLLWFKQGYIEYRFPNVVNPLLHIHELSFSMEICSEAPGYLENWPSDITVSVNGIELATYTSPGDFGARRGKLTPLVWPNSRTQYGILKTFSLREDGSYLDGELVSSSVTLYDAHIMDKPYISLRIEIKSDAKNIGGINIFGNTYGDYPQGIIMNIIYENSSFTA